jgi:hypothetical protein
MCGAPDRERGAGVEGFQALGLVDAEKGEILSV